MSERMLDISFGDPMRFTCWGDHGCGATLELPRSEWEATPYGFSAKWLGTHEHKEGVL